MDLGQDVAFAAFEHFETFGSQGHFDGWVLRRAKWLALDRLRIDRALGARFEIDAASPDQPMDLPATAPQDDLAVQEIMVAIGQLPERQRLSLLGAVYGESTAETARRMGISEATVRSLIRFARLSLLDLLPDVQSR